MPVLKHSESWWRQNIQQGLGYQRPGSIVEAVDFIDRLDTSCRPFLATCSDDKLYWIKAFGPLSISWLKRSLVTDQIAGRLACVMGAPVGHVSLIEVSDTFLDPGLNPDLSDIAPGIYHASERIVDCNEDKFHVQKDDDESRERVALLSLFYGWFVADDRQCLYENEPPHRIHSIDHGCFLPGRASWSCETLAQYTSLAVPDSIIMAEYGIVRKEQEFALRGLAQVTDNSIAFAVSSPPPEWGITMDERVALAMFLSRRRDELFKYFGILN